MKNTVNKELNKARNTWKDLPPYVYTLEYEKALTEWIEKIVEAGRKDIRHLVVYALDHETGDKMPYFPFNRLSGERRVL